MQIDERYSDLSLGLVGVDRRASRTRRRARIATRDVRHFSAVRLHDGSPFELVVHPSDPDRS
jgi:hypothetical protein